MAKTAYNLVCEALLIALREQDYDMEFTLGMVIAYAKQDRMRELTNILCAHGECNGMQNLLVPTMHQVNSELFHEHFLKC